MFYFSNSLLLCHRNTAVQVVLTILYCSFNIITLCRCVSKKRSKRDLARPSFLARTLVTTGRNCLGSPIRTICKVTLYSAQQSLILCCYIQTYEETHIGHSAHTRTYACTQEKKWRVKKNHPFWVVGDQWNEGLRFSGHSTLIDDDLSCTDCICQT